MSAARAARSVVALLLVGGVALAAPPATATAPARLTGDCAGLDATAGFSDIGRVVSVHAVEGGDLGDAETGDADDADETFAMLAELMPEDQQERMCALVRYRSPETLDGGVVLGFVAQPRPGAGRDVVFGINVDATESQGLALTLAHETLHVRLKDAKAFDPSCSFEENTYVDACLVQGGLLDRWVERFWPDALLDAWETDVAGAADPLTAAAAFYADERSRWVSDYAPFNPEEDFAETYSYWLLDMDAGVDGVAAEKFAWLDEQPELVAVKNFVQGNGVEAEQPDEGPVAAAGVDEAGGAAAVVAVLVLLLAGLLLLGVAGTLLVLRGRGGAPAAAGPAPEGPWGPPGPRPPGPPRTGPPAEAWRPSAPPPPRRAGPPPGPGPGGGPASPPAPGGRPAQPPPRPPTAARPTTPPPPPPRRRPAGPGGR